MWLRPLQAPHPSHSGRPYVAALFTSWHRQVGKRTGNCLVCKSWHNGHFACQRPTRLYIERENGTPCSDAVICTKIKREKQNAGFNCSTQMYPTMRLRSIYKSAIQCSKCDSPKEALRSLRHAEISIALVAAMLVPHKLLNLVVVVRPVGRARNLWLRLLLRLLVRSAAQNGGCGRNVFRDCV